MKPAEKAEMLLPSHHREGAALVKLLRALLGDTEPETSAHELEGVFSDLGTAFWLESAEGVQLDILGLILGVDRGGLPDEDYRVRLRLQTVMNRSQGRPEDLIDAVNVWIAPKTVQILEAPPAHAYIYVRADKKALPPPARELMQRVAPAGVAIDVTTTESLAPFGFYEDAGARGFAEANGGHSRKGEEGGALAELLE